MLKQSFYLQISQTAALAKITITISYFKDRISEYFQRKNDILGHSFKK